MSDHTRTAWVVADTETDVLDLDLAAFERIQHRFPYTSSRLVRNLARILGDRLGKTTELLAAGPPAPDHPASQALRTGV